MPSDLAAAASYRHPSPAWPGWLPRLAQAPGWTRLRRSLAKRWPLPALVSDVVDVVYLNWWLDARRAPPPPPGFRLLEHAGRTPYSILSYRHGHFGPALAGPLRQLMPSPLQSNWRWYLQRVDAPSAPPVVLFDRNLMDSLVHVAGARAFSDAMQPHLPARFEHGRSGDGYRTVIEAGQGSAPSLSASLVPAADWHADGWSEPLGGLQAALQLLTCQDEAWAMTVDGRWARTRIELPVAVSALRPLRVAEPLYCPHLQALGVGAQQPFAFVLPSVPFRVVSECLP